MRRREGQQLRLVLVHGPPFASVQVEPGTTLILGRSPTCGVQLPDPAVSPRHASLSCPGGTWLVTDLGSRTGVLLNALPVAPDVPSPLNDLDLLTIGPWILRVRLGLASSSARQRIGSAHFDSGKRVDPIPRRELRSLARRRLDLLLDCAASINAASNQKAFARAIVEAAQRGTGFPRVAVLRLVGEEVEVLAETGGIATDEAVFSRALLQTAAEGRVARLRRDTPACDTPVVQNELTNRSGLQEAICAPIMVGDAVDAFLYLDDYSCDACCDVSIEPDAAGFCTALCRIGGLALANQRRAALERLNAEIMHDVGAAAEAQRLLMPKPHGRCHGVSYSMRMQPGHFVAGDLFNILPLDDGRVGVYLGDVAGKGVGAAILMATTQTMLNAALRTTGSPAEALNTIEPELATMLPGGRFISLWVGIIDPVDSTIRFVDAGHGHWLVRESAEAAPAVLSTVGGLPLGIDPETRYHDEKVRLSPTGRIVLLSDGVLEQRANDGTEFGITRTIETLTGTASTREDVERLFEAIRSHAATETLDDDVTIASIGFGET